MKYQIILNRELSVKLVSVISIDLTTIVLLGLYLIFVLKPIAILDVYDSPFGIDKK